MKTRASAFVYSNDLFAAALVVLGKADSVSLARAMRDPKQRRALREQQLRLTQKAKATTGGDA